jgi:polar amino acid transport system substrate-binding protein
MWKKGNVIEGIGTKVIRQIARDLSIDFANPYIGPWKRVLRSLEMSEIDMISSLYKTEKRQKIYEFTDYFMEDPVAIVTARDMPFSFSQWEDLVGQPGVATLGDSYGEKFDRYIDEKLMVRRVSSYQQLFKLVVGKRVAYGIGPLYTLKAIAKRDGLEDQVRIAEQLVTTEKLYMAFALHSGCRHYKDAINQRMAIMRETGDIDRIIEESILEWSSQK